MGGIRMNKLFLSVDLGTSYIKAGVYDLGGHCLAIASEPVPDERPAPGIFIQRGEQLYAAACACISHAVHALQERANDVAAIAFTGQMAGSMGVDAHWNDITGWSCSLDNRYLPYANRQRENHDNELFEIGATSAPVMCSKYEWFKNEFPQEHKRIAKYVMLNGFLIGKLSGIPVEEAEIDYSLITWTGLADIRKRSWSKTLCDSFGVDMAMLPKIVDCTHVGGYLSDSAAKALGLSSGIPLVLGAGDKVSGCTGAGILDDGDMIFEAASYGAVSCKVPTVQLDDTSRSYDIIGGIDASSYYAHKYIQGSGITTDWFVNSFMREKNMDVAQAFAHAEKLAKGIPAGSERLLAIGLLGGSAMPFDSEMRGLFIGHSWTHHRGHFYHALLESFSYDLALTLEAMDRQYPEYRKQEIKLIGGGARSTIWPQLLADITGRRFVRLDREDVALWGAALLSAAGTGNLADLHSTAKAGVHIKTSFTPNEDMHEKYQKYIRTYDAFTHELHSFYQRLNAL